MNYIALINAFWLAHEEHEFTPIEICLYFYLLKVANMLRWKNPFNRNSSKILSDLGISRSASENSRLRLKKFGIIDFKSINGSANIEFTIIDISKKYALPNDECSDDSNAGHNAGHNAGYNAGRQTGKSGGEAASTEGGNKAGNKVLNINKTKTILNKNTYRAFAHLALLEDEFLELVEMGFSKNEIDDVLDGIENYKGNKKYDSLFLSAKAWLKKGKGSAQKEITPGGPTIYQDRKRDKAINAFDAYKEKGYCTDWDNEIYDYLLAKKLIAFSPDENYRFLMAAVNTAKQDHAREPAVTELEKSGKLATNKELIADAKQIALMEYFNQLAEVGQQLKDLLNNQTK